MYITNLEDLCWFTCDNSTVIMDITLVSDGDEIMTIYVMTYTTPPAVSLTLTHA